MIWWKAYKVKRYSVSPQSLEEFEACKSWGVDFPCMDMMKMKDLFEKFPRNMVGKIPFNKWIQVVENTNVYIDKDVIRFGFLND